MKAIHVKGKCGSKSTWFCSFNLLYVNIRTFILFNLKRKKKLIIDLRGDLENNCYRKNK
jgi:hypothetical protein